MTCSNSIFRRSNGTLALFGVSLLLAGSLTGCSPDPKDSQVSSKDAQVPTKVEPTLRDGALHGGEGQTWEHLQSDTIAGRRASAVVGASEVSRDIEPVAVGVSLQPFGPAPGPGQVQWPSDKTPAPIAAPTTSPF
jgi:hypothetical protein